MLLTVDVGNSETMVALFEGARPADQWRITSSPAQTGDELFVLYHAWFTGLYLGLPFLLLFYTGFFYTGVMSGFQAWINQFRLRQPLWRLA